MEKTESKMNGATSSACLMGSDSSCFDRNGKGQKRGIEMAAINTRQIVEQNQSKDDMFRG
jgi:hypothetical protein